MTPLTWVYIGSGFVLGIIALIGFFGLRAKRSQLTRQHWPLFVGQFVLWMIPMVFFFRGVLALFYFITVAVIYIPTIVYILKLPKDDQIGRAHV